MRPTFAEFLQQPIDLVNKIVPETVVYSCAGSRRQAALAGVPATGNAFAQWSHEQMLKTISMLMRYQIRHLFLPLLLPNQFKETTPNYREKLESWVEWGIASPAMLDFYQEQQWRVRLLGTEPLPGLHATAERLYQTDRNGQQHLWWYIVPDQETAWQTIFQATKQTAISTRSEAIQTIYGQPIAPAELFISFGKPMLNAHVVPPLLVGELQCYWTQKPGYDLSEAEFRQILYDFAYTRQTWQSDKTERTKAALEFRQHWKRGPILGLGQQLGPFWYPQPTSIELEL